MSENDGKNNEKGPNHEPKKKETESREPVFPMRRKIFDETELPMQSED